MCTLDRDEALYYYAYIRTVRVYIYIYMCILLYYIRRSTPCHRPAERVWANVRKSSIIRLSAYIRNVCAGVRTLHARRRERNLFREYAPTANFSFRHRADVISLLWAFFFFFFFVFHLPRNILLQPFFGGHPSRPNWKRISRDSRWILNARTERRKMYIQRPNTARNVQYIILYIYTACLAYIYNVMYSRYSLVSRLNLLNGRATPPPVRLLKRRQEPDDEGSSRRIYYTAQRSRRGWGWVYITYSCVYIYIYDFWTAV